MSVLRKLRDWSIPIDWATARVARDPAWGHRRAEVSEISELAAERLDGASPEQLPWVAELCAASSEAAIDDALAGLAPDASSSSSAYWKVVCALLDETLQALPRDPISGPAELSSFWLTVGSPAGHPHVFQGVGNEITPGDYYTPENLTRMVESQREWLARRVDQLRSE